MLCYDNGNGGKGGNGGSGNGGSIGYAGNGGEGGSTYLSITNSTIYNMISIGHAGSGGAGGNGAVTGLNGESGYRSGNIYNNIFYTTSSINLPDIPLYTTPIPGTNIIGGHTIAGNYWPNYGGYNYLNFKNTSL